MGDGLPLIELPSPGCSTCAALLRGRSLAEVLAATEAELSWLRESMRALSEGFVAREAQAVAERDEALWLLERALARTREVEGRVRAARLLSEPDGCAGE